tara:strand:- start:77 stop:274 length:198 start_codon:yes stop_codon:yes gene_type:complete
MFTMAAIGWRASGLLRSIDHRLDVAMVLIKRHDEMHEAAKSSRKHMHNNIHEMKTWMRVHEERHA